MVTIKQGDWVQCACGAIGRAVHSVNLRTNPSLSSVRVEWYKTGSSNRCGFPGLHRAGNISTPVLSLLTVVEPTPEQKVEWLL